jgi:thiol-disulfide isomerase/thioredoxin
LNLRRLERYVEAALLSADATNRRPARSEMANVGFLMGRRVCSPMRLIVRFGLRTSDAENPEIPVPQSVHAFAIAALVAIVPASTLIASTVQSTPPSAVPQAEPAKVTATATATESDPEARAILEKARAAAKAAEDISAVLQSKVSGGGESAGMKARVSVVFSNELFPIKAWRFDMMAEKDGDTTPQPSVSGTAGKIYRLNPTEKELVEMDLGGMPAFPQDETFVLLPTWYLSERADGSLMPGMPKPKIISEKMVGDREVGGVKCKVVHVLRETSMQGMGDEAIVMKEDVTMALGVDDSLPRHVLSKLTQSMGSESMTQEFETTYTDLKVNSKPADDVFAMKAPEGFKTTAAKMDDMMPKAPEMKAKVGDPALEFALKDPSGTEYTLAGLKGKVVVLDFWATWCGPCKQAMPDIQAIHEHFKDQPVAIFGVNVSERSPTAGADYMKSKNFTYGCLLAGEKLAEGYAISGIPTIIVIDTEGKIVHAQAGFGPGEKEHLIKLIEGALPKKG